jgi:WD40 repeat protein
MASISSWAPIRENLVRLSTVCVVSAALGVPVVAQAPSTDIYLADISLFDGVYFVGALRNITRRSGAYDNQPMFTPDSRSILYTAGHDDGNDGQTEIHRYYVDSGRDTRITRTDESEYSATPIPGDRAFSAIRVEADSAQRLWRFTMEGMDAEVVLPDVEPVGYHAWGDANTLILFVLGDPPTLQIADVTTGTTSVLAENVGRSLHKIPTRAAFSFVQRVSADEAWIGEVDIASHQINRIIDSLGGGQDHTWTPDGIVLMASGSRLYQYNSEIDDGWRLIADLSESRLSFTRLTVSPDGTKLAIVGQQARPGGG